MKELTKLTPELENNISHFEDMIFTVESAGTREEVITVIRSAKTIKARIVEFFKESKESAHKTWKAICANEKTFTDRLDVVELKAKKAVRMYDDEQAVIRDKERARLQAAADAKARQERERLRKKAEITKTPERAEALIEEAESILAPVVQVEEPEKNKGEATKRTWKAKITDPDKVPREWLVIDMKALDAFAKATKGNKQIPGVEFVQESTLAITI